MTLSADINSIGRPLRILIVDDNHINLSVLTTLLKRRFGHILEGAPISVDSGLKAIQLLRTHVFDCIFMDIQMPFLSGLEAARRIRNAEDGILAANCDAHIVAVTTAVGEEPSFAYKRARMDGMIGKPVRFHHLQQYLVPLAHEAYLAAPSVPPIEIDGEKVMPPLPPVSNIDRVFYLASDAITPLSRPDICQGSDFEKLLQSQTRVSLIRFSATTTDFASSSGTTSHVVNDSDTTFVPEVDSDGPSTPTSDFDPSPRSKASHSKPQHSRTGSMKISQRILSRQIAREVANAVLDGDAKKSHKDTGAITASVVSPSRTIRHSSSRPEVLHRITAPAWLTCGDNQSRCKSSKRILPKLSSTNWSQSSSGSSGISGTSSDTSDDSYPSPNLRRESQTSTGSTSSDVSSTVTTPACDSPLPFWSSEVKAFDFGRDHERTLSSRTINPMSSSDSSDDHIEEIKRVWNINNETITSTSSTQLKRIEETAQSGDTGTSIDDTLFSSVKHTTYNRKQENLTHDSLFELTHNTRQVSLT